MKKRKSLKGSIIKLRKKNFTINQIVKKLKCSRGTVSYHINNEGLGGRINKGGGKFLVVTKRMENKVVKLRKQRMTFKEIQKEVPLSKDKISIICKKHNLPQATRSKHIFITKEIIKTINIVYNKLKSIRKAAKELNLNRATVRKYVKNIINRKTVKDEDKKKKNVEYVNIARRKRKIDLIELKGGKCEVCGYNKSVAALHFHHLSPENKNFTIGGRNYSWEIMKEEVNKCALLCSNCHCEVHEEMRQKGYSNIINDLKIVKNIK